MSQGQETETFLDEERVTRVITEARALFAQRPDWTIFFRTILGVAGSVRRTFTTSKELELFYRSPEGAELMQMLGTLRAKAEDRGDSQDPMRVITVRLPRSLHELLKTEAHDYHTSMNKLCISKLLQGIDGRLVPKDSEPVEEPATA